MGVKLDLCYGAPSISETVFFISIFCPQLVLVPRYSSLEMFIGGDPASIHRKDAFERFHCHSNSGNVQKSSTSEVCSKLITSMSAILHDGALGELKAMTDSMLMTVVFHMD